MRACVRGVRWGTSRVTLLCGQTVIICPLFDFARAKGGAQKESGHAAPSVRLLVAALFRILHLRLRLSGSILPFVASRKQPRNRSRFAFSGNWQVTVHGRRRGRSRCGF